MKECIKCKIKKELADFSKNSNQCKSCKNLYRKSYYLKNKNKEKERNKNWRNANKEKHRGYYKDYYFNNTAKEINRSVIKYCNKLQRTVKWADTDKIKTFYEESKRLTEQTGIKHHVDHIIPLQGKLVSGLHVENNLQVIPAFENLSKSNKFDPNKTVTGEPNVHNNSN